MFPTKTDSGKRHHASLVELASRAMAIRAEMKAGYPRSTAAMSFSEFLAYVETTKCCEAEDLTFRDELLAYIKAGFGFKQS